MHTETPFRETPPPPEPAGFSYKLVMGAVLLAVATQGLLSIVLLDQAGGEQGQVGIQDPAGQAYTASVPR